MSWCIVGLVMSLAGAVVSLSSDPAAARLLPVYGLLHRIRTRVLAPRSNGRVRLSALTAVNVVIFCTCMGRLYRICIRRSEWWLVIEERYRKHDTEKQSGWTRLRESTYQKWNMTVQLCSHPEQSSKRLLSNLRHLQSTTILSWCQPWEDSFVPEWKDKGISQIHTYRPSTCTSSRHTQHDDQEQ